MQIFIVILNLFVLKFIRKPAKRNPGVRDTGAFEGWFGQIAAACWGFAALGILL